ncbi:putative immunoglobulin-blocking virulence protein [Mycoplasmopsis felis]|uniref:putative immunoglobulin-blocking virulence protein n=1 Tax=Mycoplasmopsis felis TaxID=33923 RepID=UPI002AFDD2D7|nr:putative immunoglobulin-blocking virulence protein [Mycoplasmopsis felis]WQQ10624.1 putative immunoglobulin-blocking virulence protein [Mycoplasmopsis felis]
MNKILKRKNKFFTILTGTTIVASSSVALTLYQSTSSIGQGKDSNYPSYKNGTLIPIDNADGGVLSIFDRGIKQPEKKVEPKLPEPPKVEPIKEEPIIKEPEKPIEKPRIEQPKVSPIVEIKPQNQPEKPVETPKPKEKEVVIERDNYTIKVKVKDVPLRKDLRSDIEKGITNRKPYYAEIVPDVTSVEVTEETRQKTIANGQKNLDRQINTNQHIFALFRDPNLHEKSYDSILKGPNEDYFVHLYDKFSALLENGDKVKEFLLPEGVANYNQLRSISGIYQYVTRNGQLRPIKLSYLAIISYLDFTKFTELTDNAKKQLENGYYIAEDNNEIIIDANGKLDSRVYSPIFNKVTAERERNNSEKRVFGINSVWSRNPEDIRNGNYPGWTKRDISTEYYNNPEYNLNHNDGILLYELTKNADNKAKTSIDKGVLVSINASNPSGYSKTLALINKLKEKEIPITGYRITNMGKSDSTQKFKEILSALPNELPFLELFFESPNTSSLIALEDKVIDELSLFSSLNPNDERFSFNPWAFKRTHFVNTLDYNSYGGYLPGVQSFSRINFNSISFDESDWNSIEDTTRINNGLRMVYVSRNNERIFQGQFGPGNHPDRDNAGNSYPTGLDLSRIKAAKSLRNLIFYDQENDGTRPDKVRKLTRIVLYNNSDVWEIDSDELNNAQFHEILEKDPNLRPKSKIIFSNGKNTRKIRIKAKENGHSLNSSGINNLRTLLGWSDNTFNSNTEILVDPTETNLINSLSGFNVVRSSGADDDLVIT